MTFIASSGTYDSSHTLQRDSSMVQSVTVGETGSHQLIRATRFESSVQLTKREAFDACQALADADRFLVRAGRLTEASALADLFELFEERLTSGSRR